MELNRRVRLRIFSLGRRECQAGALYWKGNFSLLKLINLLTQKKRPKKRSSRWLLFLVFFSPLSCVSQEKNMSSHGDCFIIDATMERTNERTSVRLWIVKKKQRQCETRVRERERSALTSSSELPSNKTHSSSVCLLRALFGRLFRLLVIPKLTKSRKQRSQCSTWEKNFRFLIFALEVKFSASLGEEMKWNEKK